MVLSLYYYSFFSYLQLLLVQFFSSFITLKIGVWSSFKSVHLRLMKRELKFFSDKDSLSERIVLSQARIHSVGRLVWLLVTRLTQRRDLSGEFLLRGGLTLFFNCVTRRIRVSELLPGPLSRLTWTAATTPDFLRKTRQTNLHVHTKQPQRNHKAKK